MHLRNTITSLADWKLRASIAEVTPSSFAFSDTKAYTPPLDGQTRVEELKQNASQSQAFAKEIKEKNVLIGKLRHESEVFLFPFSLLVSVELKQTLWAVDVIMNEHLTEALRRLRKNSSDTNVDRFVPFLCFPNCTP